MSHVVSEDAKAAISARNRQFEEHLRNGDAAALVRDYYVPAPLVVPPDAPLLREHKDVEAFFAGIMQAVASCSFETVELRQAGEDAVYELGQANMVMKDETAPDGAARYLIVWRRTADGWRAEADFFAYGGLA